MSTRCPCCDFGNHTEVCICGGSCCCHAAQHLESNNAEILNRSCGEAMGATARGDLYSELRRSYDHDFESAAIANEWDAAADFIDPEVRST